MGKTVFAAHDTPTRPLTGDEKKKEEAFAICLDIGYRGIEDLLVTEVSPDILRTYLSTVASRDDYPQYLGYLPGGAADEEAIQLAKEILEARKATEFAPQLPPTLAKLMLDINAHLAAEKLAGTAEASESAIQAGEAERHTPDSGGPGSA